jgi:glyoxylase-like metal-dependent hydrolase (beta-lactamase superfamily II)
MILETITIGAMEVNCYILARSEGQEAIIIDPGAEERKIGAALAKYQLRPGIVVNTHGHYDHIGCDDKFGVPVFIHKKDAPFLTNPLLNLSAVYAFPYKAAVQIATLEDKQLIEHAGLTLEVLHLPGHTPGGIALLLKKPQGKIVFSGDTLFCQGIGRTDLAGGDETLLLESIKERLLSLPADTVVYPGHGPATTIGEEKLNNSFLHDPKRWLKDSGW